MHGCCSCWAPRHPIESTEVKTPESAVEVSGISYICHIEALSQAREVSYVPWLCHCGTAIPPPWN